MAKIIEKMFISLQDMTILCNKETNIYHNVQTKWIKLINDTMFL